MWELYRLIREPERWRSLDVTYEEPRVERIWTELLSRATGEPDGCRISLHCIHPTEKPFRHTHKWPSAVLVCEGSYEMAVGEARGRTTPSSGKQELVGHETSCALRIASEGSAGIECRHGFDVCPKCDACTCKGPAARIHLGPGSIYEMTCEQDWHSVRPLHQKPVYSIMVSGPPYRPGVKEEGSAKNQPLSPERAEELRRWFQRWVDKQELKT
jgi:hypothetical protein